MTAKTLALAALATTILSGAAIADSSLGTPTPPPTPVREWFHTNTVLVQESVQPSGRHQCTFHIMNGSTAFGVQSSYQGVKVFLLDQNLPWFTPGYARIQIDNATPWRINGEADDATPNIWLSEKLNDDAGPKFLPQLMYGQILRVETKDRVYPFSLAGSAAGIEATVACERAINGKAPNVRPVGPPRQNDLIL